MARFIGSVTMHTMARERTDLLLVNIPGSPNRHVIFSCIQPAVVNIVVADSVPQNARNFVLNPPISVTCVGWYHAGQAVFNALPPGPVPQPIMPIQVGNPNGTPGSVFGPILEFYNYEISTVAVNGVRPEFLYTDRLGRAWRSTRLHIRVQVQTSLAMSH